VDWKLFLERQDLSFKLTLRFQFKEGFPTVRKNHGLFKLLIEENILFGSPLDSDRLRMAVECAGLSNDLSNLPDGIKTQIGDQGVSLSGGQKSRVSLARAFYSQHEILLLDDPLSSCDAKVGRFIFNQLPKALSGRTSLMVTRSFEHLSKMDFISVFGRRHGQRVWYC